MKNKVDPRDIALEQALAHARAGILPFTQWTFDGTFEVNWHHRLLAKKLDAFVERRIQNLMVFMPPRLGKSELISRRMPAYILGRNPRARVIATSYSADLAQAMSRDVQFVIDSEPYRQLFPGTVLSGSNVRSNVTGTYLRNSDIFETVPYRGVYKCAGTGGGIVGTGANFLIIDDPVKNAAEAESETYRAALYDWYRSTLYSRREKGAGICLVMQRWHDDDLAGRILKEAKADPDYPQFDVVTFPMLSTDNPMPGDPRKVPGMPLWPGKFDARECKAMQKTQGSRNWQALYQQDPNEEGGNEVKQGMLRYWSALPQYPDRIIISCDAAFKGTATSSYVAIQVWFQHGPNYYLADQDRRRIGFLDTIRALKAMREKWPSASGFLIEDKANGPAIVETLRTELAGVMESSPHGSKLARLRAVTPLMEAGNVWIPSPETHHWVPAYEKEMQTVPNCKDWDQVDTTSQALHWFQENTSTIEMLNNW